MDCATRSIGRGTRAGIPRTYPNLGLSRHTSPSCVFGHLLPAGWRPGSLSCSRDCLPRGDCPLFSWFSVSLAESSNARGVAAKPTVYDRIHHRRLPTSSSGSIASRVSGRLSVALPTQHAQQRGPTSRLCLPAGYDREGCIGASVRAAFYCVASMADDAISAFVDDPRYQFRWIVDEGLDPNDRMLFDVTRVSLDGRELNAREVAPRLQYKARQVSYSVPRGHGESRRHKISFDVLVRKHFGSERRVRIRTQLFQTTFGADFRCTISESVLMSKAWISTSEVTGFGPMQPVTGKSRLVQGLPCSLHVRYDAPLQPGSTVAFHLDRP